MKKNDKAFTLIELLAIIVILAIIAVITVPIILDIIENSRRGAASDSAYGFKDAINKYYVQELANNNSLKLQGTYTVSNGTLNGDGITNVAIPVSGDKPSSGKLHYTNNVLDDGCLVIGDYKVTFKSDGSVNETVKGDCDDYVIIPTMAEMCPGCKFIYTTSYLTIGTSDMPSSATDDYTDWTSGENSHPYFLGLIESTTSSGKIGRAFACGVENDTPFCLEGTDTSKWSDDYNVGVLNTIFSSCNASASDSDASCHGSGVGAYAYDYGSVGVYDARGSCDVYGSGNFGCGEQ